MNKTDEEMLKKWLSSKEEAAFENGIKCASYEILENCKSLSMPITDGDDTFYVSIEEIKNTIKNTLTKYTDL